MSGAEDLTGELKAQVLALGFDRVGVARVEPLEREAAALGRWIEAGHHASMGWMADTEAVRADPTHPGMLPGARSVLVAARSYAREIEPVGPRPGVVARYARGRDYHNVLRKRLRKIAKRLRELGHPARVSVDTVPFLERAWAQRAGVGFVGKNCCLIVPGLGSHLFLGAVVSAAELVPDEPTRERCGSCDLCLRGCPTEAFTEARSLDARRCVSYLTIEHRGPIEASLREGIGGWIFGCDVCQDVCPYNHTRAPGADPPDPFAPHSRWGEVDAEALLTMSEQGFTAYAHGSPLRRAGREGMARNAALVLGNRGGERHLPVLREAARSDPSATVREAAEWALNKIRKNE